MAARAKPDGYTILAGGSGPLAANKLIYRNLPYDPETDFTPLSLVAEAPLMLMAHPSLPVKSVPELIAEQGVDGALLKGSCDCGEEHEVLGEDTQDEFAPLSLMSSRGQC
jgi:tripartite-type tricarboxylate transporter receptor subunit TctC